MKRIVVTLLATALLLLAVLARNGGERSGGDRVVQAGSMPDAAPLTATSVTSTEFWRLGVTSESGAIYGITQGRPLHLAAAFRSNRGTSDVYYIFPAPGSQRTIQAARFHILSRTGAYDGDATLALEILDYGGTVQRTVSAVEIDIKAAPTGTWTGITLSGTGEDLTIASGEFLAFHFSLGGTPGGDLEVRLIFEVGVTAHQGYLIVLPLVLRDSTP